MATRPNEKQTDFRTLLKKFFIEILYVFPQRLSVLLT